MTFLEHILMKYLGKPSRCGSEPGVSYWPCPLCGHDTFHTLPDKPQFKHRAKCWNSECGFRGDVGDMLKEFHPDEPYGDRLNRMEFMFHEWQAQSRALVIGRGVKKR